MSADAHTITIPADWDFLSWCAERRRRRRPDPQPEPIGEATPRLSPSIHANAPRPVPHPLFAAPLVPATMVQRHIIDQTLARLRGWDLRFPAFTIGFVRPLDDAALGATRIRYDSARDAFVIEMRLHARLRDDRLDRTVMHEAKHVLQIATAENLTRDEAERDADVFVFRITGIPIEALGVNCLQ